MVVLLIMILAIALCFIIAGLILSSSSSTPPAQNISYAAGRSVVGARRIARRTTQPTRQARRSYVEEVPTPWSGFAESFAIGRVFQRYQGGRGRVVGFTLALVLLFCVGLFLWNTLVPNSSMIIGGTWPDAAAAATPPTNTGSSSANSAKTSALTIFSGASKALVRINQLDTAQYNSQQDYNTWAYSTCSAAAMTVVINAYGHNYRIADILKVEAGLHEITPDLGLLEPTGIDHTVAQFGFQTDWLNKPSLDDVTKVANQGHPVIVSFPPDRWAGGHLLVVRGGDSQYVYLADSSRLNMQAMARATFMKYWEGFAVVVLPK